MVGKATRLVEESFEAETLRFLVYSDFLTRFVPFGCSFGEIVVLGALCFREGCCASNQFIIKAKGSDKKKVKKKKKKKKSSAW